MSCQPSYTLTPTIVSLVAEIAEVVGGMALSAGDTLRLRRVNRIRTIRGSLAIEGNTLSEEQITAILEGKPVIAPPREIQEVRNALAAYERLGEWQPAREADLLAAHGVLMAGLLDEAGCYRTGGVGVMQGEQVIHMAPPAQRVPKLMADLLGWLKRCEEHPLIAGSVFHYEFEFIHPFCRRQRALGSAVADADPEPLAAGAGRPAGGESGPCPSGGLLPGDRREHGAVGLRTFHRLHAGADSGGLQCFAPSSNPGSDPPSKTPAGGVGPSEGARRANARTGAEGCQALPAALPAARPEGGAGGDDPAREPAQPDAAVSPDAVRAAAAGT